VPPITTSARSWRDRAARYAAYLERRNDRKAMQVLRAIRSGPAEDDARAVLMVMQRDREFMKDLAVGAVVSKEEPLYPAWREQRDRFHALWVQVFTERFALEPGSASVLRLLTYQFLHGGALHLLGNMAVLLLAAGPFAEAALGRLRFLIAYIASGAIAGAAHLLISDQDSIGASGAISGTMAMVAVLYGPARFRLLLAVRLSTPRVPAPWLLPVWLMIEAVQWALSPERASPTTRISPDSSLVRSSPGCSPADMTRSIASRGAVRGCPGGASLNAAERGASGRCC
jgi:membrane associated rhomboid family serine protease